MEQTYVFICENAHRVFLQKKSISIDQTFKIIIHLILFYLQNDALAVPLIDIKNIRAKENNKCIA